MNIQLNSLAENFWEMDILPREHMKVVIDCSKNASQKEKSLKQITAKIALLYSSSYFTKSGLQQMMEPKDFQMSPSKTLFLPNDQLKFMKKLVKKFRKIDSDETNERVVVQFKNKNIDNQILGKTFQSLGFYKKYPLIYASLDFDAKRSIDIEWDKEKRQFTVIISEGGYHGVFK